VDVEDGEAIKRKEAQAGILAVTTGVRVKAEGQPSLFHLIRAPSSTTDARHRSQW
jgi:hypothetical protein